MREDCERSKHSLSTDMVAHCCVYGCGNKYNKDGVKLFRLPTSDPEKLSVWLTLIGRKDLLKKSQKQKLTQRICSDHFREEYYKYGKTLHKDAVPCRNLIIISEESEEARPSTSKTGLCLKRHDSCRADEPLAKVTKKRVVPMENVKIIDIKEGSPPERLLTKEAFLESCDQYLDEKTSKIVKKQLALRKGHKSIKTPNQANSSDVKNTDKDNNEIKETDKEDNSDRIKTKMLYLSQRGIQISDIDETLTLSEDHIEELDATIKEEEIQIQDTFEIKEEGDVYEDVDQDPLLEVDSVLEDEVKISVSLPKNLSENPIMSSTRVEAMHISENYFNLNRKYTTKIDNKKCSDIRPDAQMLSYMKVGKYDKSHQAYRSTLAESGLKIVNDSSCCSLKRQKILSELPRQMINFLQKTPHNYFTQNKNLCCKSTINSPQVQLNELEQTISHTKKNTTRLKEVLKNIDLPSTCIVQDDCALTCKNQDSKHQSHYLHKEHTYKRLQGHQEIYTTWLNNVHSKQSVNPLEIDNQQSGNVLTDTAHTPMLMTTIPQPSEPLTPEDPTVKALIASILERFKNIHLSLSAEGKVVALLDAPAASLSNEELTILSDILTRAQEQIQSFGIIDSSSSNLADPLNANQNIINMGFTHSQQLSTDVENEKTAYDCTNNIPSNMNDQGNLNEIKRNSALEKAREEIYSSSNLYEIYSNLSYFKNIQIKHSLETYSKRGQELLGPKIMNVYSLNNDTSIANPTVKRTYQNNTRMRNALTSKETKTYSPSSCSLSKNKKIFKTLITVPRMKNKNISTMVMNQTKRQYMLQSIPQGVQTNYASPALNVPLHCFLSPNNDGSSIVRVPAIENNKISMRYPQSAPHITILNKTDNKDNEDDCILGV
ncbi:unnamed protein product [Diatraea saccharalis]|uniref:THAP-type domain-containing protein n=1 Tax=Diatraea saccharalis TaxID=40085 RepID=A0A9N9RAD3_9NEOP|nr:unnamed protein product [Diatraea saccharalis]